MKETTTKREEKKTSAQALQTCKDVHCPIHGKLKMRGKLFEGTVIKKFPKRIAIVFERMIYVKKYERYKKSQTKVHARLSPCMQDDINIGDYVQIRECRPLSRIIHFVVVKKIKDAEEKKK